MDSDKPLLRLQYVENCIAQWWEQFHVQNFSSLVPRQKWFMEKRNVKVGDVVLIKYEGKCKPGTYRLGVVREVEECSDGLVRTVLVEYSLLGEVPAEDRHLYTGVTKKKISLPVQRLVLVLPVEEQFLLPGGPAGGDPAPHDEVVGVRNTWKKKTVSSLLVSRSGMKRELGHRVTSCRILDACELEEVRDVEKEIYGYLFVEEKLNCFVEIQ